MTQDDPYNRTPRKCLQCGIRHPETDFAGPDKKVCTFCTTDAGFAVTMDRRVALARDAYFKLLSAANLPKFAAAPRISDLLAGFFKTWGGQEQFIADLVTHGRELLQKKPTSPDTSRFFVNMLKLVNEDNKREDDLEVKRMTDEQIRQERAMGLFELAMESMADEAKSQMVADLLSAFSLPRTPAITQEVTMQQVVMEEVSSG